MFSRTEPANSSTSCGTYPMYVTELHRVPMHDFGSVEPDLPRRRRNETDEQAAQRALAGCRRPDDGDEFTGQNLETDVAKNCHLGRSIPNVVDYEMALRSRKLDTVDLGGEVIQADFQTLIGKAGRGEIAPGGHRHLDRRKGTAQKDGCRDHRAGAEITVDHEMRPDGQNQNLRKEAREPREPQNNAAALRCPTGRLHGIAVLRLPTADDGRMHSHRVHDFRVPNCSLGLLHGRNLRETGGEVGFSRHHLVADAQCQQKDCSPERDHAEQRVQHPDERDVHDNPRRIEEHRQSAATQRMLICAKSRSGCAPAVSPRN